MSKRRVPLTLLLILCVAVVVRPVVSIALTHDAEAQKKISSPGFYSGYSAPGHTGFVTKSFYLSMPDGVNLAVDVSLPADMTTEDKIPTLIKQTRLWRSREGDQSPGQAAEFFLSHGYAWIVVDVRGTGASSGSLPYPSSAREIKDGMHVVNWIVKQAWSNGKVGTFGNGYSGRAAEFLLVNKHPSVRAAVICCSMYDTYADVVFPGGIHQTWFTESWTEMTRALDANDPYVLAMHSGLKPAQDEQLMGVKPVDGDEDRSLLKAAIEDHASNYDLHQDCLAVQYRDDPVPSGFGTFDLISPFLYRAEFEDSGAAVYSFSGWFDSGCVRSATNRYMTISNPGKLIIGGWPGSGLPNVSPWKKPDSPQFDHNAELLRFFDYHLKGIDNGIMDEKPVHYYTMGEEKWKASDDWPLRSQKMTRYYFTEGHLLSTKPPSGEEAYDEYQVDFSTGTGNASRWNSMYNRSRVQIGYPDRALEDEKLLVYDTLPLESDLEVTGHPIVHLYVSSSEIDAGLFVYLEDVDASGRVTYLTEGLLQMVSRKKSEARPYQTAGPYHSFTRDDMSPLIPGEAVEVSIELLPTSVLLRKGHRIRVAIAGADKDHFALSGGIAPMLKVHRSSELGSNIELPVIPASR